MPACLPVCTRAGKVRGAVAILAVMGCLVAGPALPLVNLGLFAAGRYELAFTFLGGIVGSWVVAAHSPAWCAFFLGAAGFFEEGVFLHVHRDALAAMADRPVMWCMHPHGTSIGFGFTLNGAIRFRAEDEDRFVPAEVAAALRADRMRRADGVQAPILFRLPLLRNALLGFGCCTPATKSDMGQLMRSKVDFGILPGGMEEVALYARGRERVYVAHRAGFVKYALQHGYMLQPAYTFGEADQYTALDHPLYRRLCLFTLRTGGFVLPVFWGPRWYAPFLPAATTAIHTVVAEPVRLPKILEPTNEDVAKYHGLYVAALRKIFDDHKARFGYADRQLEVL